MALLLILFIVVPIVELYVIIQVGEAIGLVPTLVLLLADAILGSLLLKREGRSAWRRFSEALTQKRFPGKEVADGLLIVIGGTLLLAPGFLTDIVGLFLLIPPTRAVARKVLKRLTIGRFTILAFPQGAAAPHRRRESEVDARPYDIDATAEEIPLDGDKRHLQSPDGK